MGKPIFFSLERNRNDKIKVDLTRQKKLMIKVTYEQDRYLHARYYTQDLQTKLESGSLFS